MWLLPFDRVSLDSQRSSAELLAALGSLIRPHSTEFRFVRSKETATLVGEVSKERLAFRRAFHGRNSFAPYVIGRIVDGPTGARIEAVMRPHTIVLIFMGAWLAALAPFALLGIRELVDGAQTKIEAWVPLLMWSVMYPMCMASFVPEARKMRRILREVTSGIAPTS